MNIKKHQSYQYAYAVVNDLIEAPSLFYELNGEKIFVSPKYIKLQCKEFLKICDDDDPKYCINEKRVKNIDTISKLLKMAKGLRAGKSVYSSLSGYQWLLIVASLCVVYRENKKKRRYETILLEICRKQGKTFIVAYLFLLLFYLEPPFSRFFSVAPDGSLAKEIKQALEPLIKVNLDVFKDGEFKILRDSITRKENGNVYFPLNYSTNRLDGKEVGVFICDEVGALPNEYPIEAMRSGQLMTPNKLGFIISTKYPTIDNPFESEVKYAKQVLDGMIEDETVFALLFEPDEEIKEEWATNDLVLLQSNPLAVEIESLYRDLLKKRNKAIAQENTRENFVTKHCNIIYQGASTESYIDVSEVQKCKVAKIDWTGRTVYLGVDLSETNDNTSVAMVSVDEDENLLIEAIAFIPEGRIEEKNKFEKVDYREFIRTSKCIASGDRIIDYSVVEDFVLSIEEKYGVQVSAIGYDKWNARSSAQKFEKEGNNVVEVRQHSSVLHPPTKFLKEKILNGEVQYEENKLLEINFQNAKCTYDTNKNLYVNKKKSNGKIDMVVAIITATYLLQQDVIFNQMDFVVQEI